MIDKKILMPDDQNRPARGRAGYVIYISAGFILAWAERERFLRVFLT
jgi:hypothetical protein